MKVIKYPLAVAALTIAFTLSAKADVITDLGEFATPYNSIIWAHSALSRAPMHSTPTTSFSISSPPPRAAY